MDHRVTVIGAGFAGVTAARELATRGCDVLFLDATGLEEAASVVSSLLPGAQVMEVRGRSYEHAGPTLHGAGQALRREQLSRFQPQLNFLPPAGRIAFVTSGIATGWSGCIDGAIETASSQPARFCTS